MELLYQLLSEPQRWETSEAVSEAGAADQNSVRLSSWDIPQRRLGWNKGQWEGFPGGLAVKNLPAIMETQEMSVQSLGWKDLERACQLTPVFLLGESHGQRSLVGSSQWSCKELDMTEVTEHAHMPACKEQGKRNKANHKQARRLIAEARKPETNSLSYRNKCLEFLRLRHFWRIRDRKGIVQESNRPSSSPIYIIWNCEVFIVT